MISDTVLLPWFATKRFPFLSTATPLGELKLLPIGRVPPKCAVTACGGIAQHAVASREKQAKGSTEAAVLRKVFRRVKTEKMRFKLSGKPCGRFPYEDLE
jgi:hypothetical protein